MALSQYKLELRVNEEIKRMRLDKLRGLNSITSELYKKTKDPFYKTLNNKVMSALMIRLGA